MQICRNFVQFCLYMQHDTLKAILKKNNASLTRPRRIIFDLLLSQKPISVRALARLASDKVDRATVYRTVELFEKFGIVHRLNIGWKYKFELSDVFLGHHHHFYCTNCGNTYSMAANTMLETMIDSVAKKSNFSPRGHQLEIYGLCAKCSKLP